MGKQKQSREETIRQLKQCALDNIDKPIGLRKLIEAYDDIPSTAKNLITIVRKELEAEGHNITYAYNSSRPTWYVSSQPYAYNSSRPTWYVSSQPKQTRKNAEKVYPTISERLQKYEDAKTPQTTNGSQFALHISKKVMPLHKLLEILANMQSYISDDVIISLQIKELNANEAENSNRE